MNTATDTSADDLRAQMVERILAEQTLTPTVEAAMRQVQRHRYVPDASLEDAYAEIAVITHTFPDGTHLSCASGPTIVAAMLNALDIHPGHHILEIGAGTGYNAALLATLTGDNGTVTTLDINAEVAANARRNLDATGFSNVTVITRDGEAGAPEHAPYDRVIVTVGAWDIPHTWWDQLTPGGRLVVPLRWRGTTRAVAFVKTDDHWESDWVFLCGFVPMLGQAGELHTTVDPEHLVTLHYDIDQPIDTDALQGVLDRQKTNLRSEVTVHGNESFDRIWVHLSAIDHGTVRIQADPTAVETHLCTPAIPIRTPAIAEDDSLAYFTIQRADDQPGRWHLGATGHGPAGQKLAQRIIDQINTWDHNRTADPYLLAYPADTPTPTNLTDHTIIKEHIRLHVRY